MRGIYGDRNLNVDAHSSGAITSTTSKDNIIPQTKENGENVISFFSNRRAGKGNNTLTYDYPNSSKESIIPQNKVSLENKDELNKNILHANASESLAGGFGGGSETIAAQRDWNEDGKVDGADVLYGAVAGALGLKTTLGGLKRVNPKAYNAIIGASETFPAMAKNNPKLLAELHKNGKANSINMFAGTKAIKADVGQLDDAMKLIDDGASETDVWKKTGWFKGDDGKWRFEIDDSGTKYQEPKMLTESQKKELEDFRRIGASNLSDADYQEMSRLFDIEEGQKKVYVLGDILKNDLLYKNYPQVQNLTVKHSGNVRFGAYNPKTNEIIVNFKDIDKSVLLHEVQHAVQNIEGFARGGNTTSKEYNLLHGEAEARLTQKRAADGYEKFPYDDLDVPRGELIKKFDDGAVEMSIETEARYINPKNGNLTPQFKKDTLPMPKPLNKKDFAKQYGDTYGWTSIETPIGEIKFNVNSAYKHMETDNTYFADRVNFSGAFDKALTDPLMIVKNPLKDGQTEYYLPLKNETDDILHSPILKISAIF